jgi:hypothetical protein
MKRLILTADNRDINDETYVKYCTSTVQAYANNHKIDFVFNKIGKVPENRHPAWARIPLFYKYLNIYDEILWVDTDVIIYNQKIDIFELLKTFEESEWKRDKTFEPVAYTIADHPTNNSHACSGIVLINCRNKERVKEFLNDWWNDVSDEKYKTEFPYDQSVWNLSWINDYKKSSYLRVANLKTSRIYSEDQAFIHLSTVYGPVRLYEAKKFYFNLINPHKYKIGIFVRQQNYYSNGVGQNCIFMKQAIESTGRFVDLIVCNADEKKQWVSSEIKYSYNDESTLNLDNYDIFIFGSLIPPIEKIRKYKNHGIKCISFNPVNVFDAFHNENFLYTEKGTSVPLLEQTFVDWADEIWVTEPHVKYSSEYLETLNLMRIPVKSVPHVWDNIFLYRQSTLPFYEERAHAKTDLIILEPNMSYAKSAWYPLMIAERLYLTHPECLGTVFLFNTPDTNKCAMNMINSLQIAKHNRIRYFSRLPINDILTFFANKSKNEGRHAIIVSHTVNVPMNYVYYESLYLGFPLVHNSDDLKSRKLGYYYDGLSNAVEKVLDIISSDIPTDRKLIAAEFINSIEPYNTTTAFNKLLEYEKKKKLYNDIDIPLLITYDNNPTKESDFFIQTCKSNDWQYKMIGAGEKWEGFITRMRGYHSILMSINPHKVVVLSDARDVVCVRSFSAFMDGFKSFNKPIVVSMELFCQGVFEYDESKPVYNCIPLMNYWKSCGITKLPNRKFVNMGLIAGYAGELVQMFEWIINKGYVDDQLGLANFTNTFPEKIAADCDAKLLHTSTFGVNAGIQDIHLQADDSITLSELFGRRAFFLHIAGANNRGQKVVYDSVVEIIKSGVNSAKLLKPYGFNEPKYNEKY